VDLLEAGVDIERLNAVVFFRYLQSPIKFYQMVGRGTRIHEETQKYKFWLYDYTDVTSLFGTDFITKPPRPGGGAPAAVTGAVVAAEAATAQRGRDTAASASSSTRRAASSSPAAMAATRRFRWTNTVAR
jgi:type I site-specific restriction endonuclease